MLTITPRVAAQWIETRARSLEMRPLRDVLTEVLTSELRANARRAISDEEIAETAEAILPKVAAALAEIADDYIKQGVDPSFQIDVSELYFCARESRESDLLHMLVAMTPKGFEHFCRKILETLMGHATVSGGPHDQCVDFYAVGLPLGGAPGPFPSSAKMVVIGQAKKWRLDAQISEGDLREFVGGAWLRVDRLRKDYADRYGLLTPASYAFWVTCDFSAGARDYANQMGLWYLNGKALAQLALRVGLDGSSLGTIENEAQSGTSSTGGASASDRA